MTLVFTKDMMVQVGPVIQARVSLLMTDQEDRHTRVRKDLVIVALEGTITVVREDQPTMDPGDQGMMDREDLHTADPGGQPMTGREVHVTQVPAVHAIQVRQPQGSFAQGFVARKQWIPS
jgi:hypothetical protein